MSLVLDATPEIGEQDPTLDEARFGIGGVWFNPDVPEDQVTSRLVDYLNAVHREAPGKIFGHADPNFIAHGIVNELELIAQFSTERRQYIPTPGEIRQTLMEFLMDDTAKEINRQKHKALPRAVTLTLVHGLDQMLPIPKASRRQKRR